MGRKTVVQVLLVATLSLACFPLDHAHAASHAGIWAESSEFHSEAEATTLTGKQGTQNVFLAPAGTVNCTTATFAGTTASKTVKAATITPTYEGCTLAGAAATIKMGGCTYKALQPTSLTNGTLEFVCPGGSQVEVLAPTCTLTIKAQGPLSKLEYTNVGSGSTREIEVTSKVESIGLIQDGTKCLGNGGAAEKLFTSGKYTGTILFTGEG